MQILITGSAGFIGSALSIRLLDKGFDVVGIDNHNNYYDPRLKEARIERHLEHPRYKHIRMSLEEAERVKELFEEYRFDVVVNLAAQAGVRYSIENPMAYIDSNLIGFAHILEGCRNSNVKHLVYASSSSVYGLNAKQPFSTHDATNHPVSLYAATKKANELMAHTYSHLYQLPTTGLRFFTVYGPYDRPDMALQRFTRAILSREPIKVFNYGQHRRDFTYIDDIVEGVARVIGRIPIGNPNWNVNEPDAATSIAPWTIYNIGNNSPVQLMDYIKALERSLGVIAEKEMLPLQSGDVPDTYADIDDLIRDFDYQPSTSVQDGVAKFVEWYTSFYG